MQMIHLPKTGGSRFENVATYKVVCDDPMSNLVLVESFKSSNEVGSHDRIFTHVAKGILKKYGKECVVKILHVDNPFYDNEIKALEELKNYKNVVQYVCHFTCNDTKERWMEEIIKDTPVQPCLRDGKHHLGFIVLEYIPNGSVLDFFDSKPSVTTLKSLFIQTALVIMELGTKYKIFQGDLNYGNILLKRTKPHASMKYQIDDDTFVKINTLGIRPVLIDFGRGGFYEKHRKNTFNIMQDVILALSVYSNWITDDNKTLKKKLLEVIVKHKQKSKKPSFTEIIHDLKSL